MKKLVNKFFGIDEHGINGTPGISYRYNPRRIECGWDIVCQIVHNFSILSTEITIVLMVLKLIGSIQIGWAIVFLPVVIRAVLDVVESMVNSKIIKINDKLRKAYYEEQMKKAAMENSEDDDRIYRIE